MKWNLGFSKNTGIEDGSNELSTEEERQEVGGDTEAHSSAKQFRKM